MKQVKFLAVALGLVIVSVFSANAQKIGYVNVDALVFNLPEAQKVQADVDKWAQDSIGGEFTRLNNELAEKDSVLKKTTTPSVKQLLEKDVNDLRLTIANWQQYAQQMYQQKQAQLFSPLYKKVADAIDAYIKEKGYTHVINAESIYKAPDADNISMAIAPKLGIKINPQGNAAGGATTPATAPKK